MAWDCGTGSGQAALGLAPFYSKVYATDPSTTQIANAVRHPAITYVAATAENCGLADHSVNAVTVAQALHWFDLHAFYREVKRVARSQAVLVAWCYGLTRIDHEIDAIIEHYYNATVGPYWPPERRYIDEQYRTLPFPFAEEYAPDEFNMQLSWNLDAVCAYLATWSATHRFREKRGIDPISALRDELLTCWGAAKQTRSVNWPIYLRIGRIE